MLVKFKRYRMLCEVFEGPFSARLDVITDLHEYLNQKAGFEALFIEVG